MAKSKPKSKSKSKSKSQHDSAPTTGPNRKPARRVAEVPAEVLNQLNAGTLETLNLVECLAVDLSVLLKSALPELPESAIAKVKNSKQKTWPARTRLCCEVIAYELGTDCLEKLLSHPSDNVRGWGAGVIAAAPQWDIVQKLEAVKPLADDPHFGTREMAWLLVRDQIIDDLDDAIQALTPWVHDPSENIRRFATEATRPRGVWCKHIPILKKKPELGLPLLAPLKSDPAKYVQNSVANWLNDAAKSKPDWVKALCKQWQSQSKAKATKYICKRAQRSL